MSWFEKWLVVVDVVSVILCKVFEFDVVVFDEFSQSELVIVVEW